MGTNNKIYNHFCIKCSKNKDGRSWFTTMAGTKVCSSCLSSYAKHLEESNAKAKSFVQILKKIVGTNRPTKV